jgi:hypothetical protein
LIFDFISQAVFRRQVDGKALAEVMATGTACGTATIMGSGEADTSITVPFKGALLTGAALKTQLDAWENACMEPDAAAAIRDTERRSSGRSAADPCLFWPESRSLQKCKNGS